MTRKPHTQLHLPPLAPDDALLVVNVIEQLVSAIWHAHGPQMLQRLQRRDPSPPVAIARLGQATVDTTPDADPFDPHPGDDIPF